jgi:hypothetical protein
MMNSPFGMISPMNNQNFKVRQSNIQRDCGGETLGMLFKSEPKYPSIDTIIFGQTS